MNISTHALQALLQSKPALARANRNLDLIGLRAPQSKLDAGDPLDGSDQGQDLRPDSSPGLYEIRFDVYSISPQDWDNIRVKELQDVLVDLGFLPDDNYRILTGSVRSMKVFKKKQQKTIITLKRIK